MTKPMTLSNALSTWPQSSGRAARVRPALQCAAAAALMLSLGGCVMVPVDSRTGQPLPTWPVQSGYRDPSVPGAVLAPAPFVNMASAYTARLYPVNDAANRAGVLTVLIVDGQNGRGQLSVQYLGEALQGEATRVGSTHPGFGQVHQTVLGAWSVPGAGRRGVANAFGGRGTRVQCEYVLTGPNQGTGVCAFSDGANFQMHFG